MKRRINLSKVDTTNHNSLRNISNINIQRDFDYLINLRCQKSTRLSNYHNQELHHYMITDHNLYTSSLGNKKSL